MDQKYKPDGYNSVSPYLVVNGAQKMIDLLINIFQASDLRRYDHEDGSIMHAEVKIDDSVIMIGDSSESYPSNQLLLHVYVADVDAVFEKALKSGCEGVETPVQKKDDPDKRGMFRDFSGNLWAVSTQMNTE